MSRASEEKRLVALLAEGLSDEEQEHVLAAALLALDGPGRERLRRRLGPETAGALAEVLAGHARTRGRSVGRPRPGKAKVRQEWDRCRSEWQECVDETSDEHGRYIEQEAHWEPPYLDLWTLAKDLDRIAERMRPLIRPVVEHDLDPGSSMRDAIAELGDDLGSGLPEWFGPPAEDFELGAKATGCLMEGEWSGGQREGRAPFEIIEGVRRLDTTTSLDRAAVSEFVIALEDPVQQEVLAGLEAVRHEPPWADVLERPHSGWFGLYRDLAARHAPDRYEALALENLAGDWRLALPLVDKRLERGEHAEAAGLCERAMGHRLPLAEGESWNPTTSLVVQHASWRPSLMQDEAEAELLEGWRQAAAGLGDGELAGALEVQLAVVRHGTDGDAVHWAFSGALGAPGFSAAQERLFASWRALVADRTIGRGYGVQPGKQPGVAWVTALVDAAWLGPPDGGQVFAAAVRGWLAVLEQRPADAARHLQALATLTLDLDVDDRLREDSPRLRQVLQQSTRGDALAQTRRGWMTALDAGGLLPEVLGFWTRHAPGLVPDPASAHGSRYGEHAAWAAAIQELSPAAAARLLAGWRDQHGRRRNLWRDLAAVGLSR